MIKKTALKKTFAAVGIAAMAGAGALVTLPVAKAQAGSVQLAGCKGCNPCAAKGKCGGCNPCAAKGKCGGCNPCAAKNKCGASNPCAAKKY